MIWTKCPGYQYVGWMAVNSFHSDLQCHGNDDASVCTRLCSWLMFVEACLFAHLPLTFLSPALSSSFRYGFMSRRSTSGNSETIDLCIPFHPWCRNCQLADVKGFTWLWRIGRYRFLRRPFAVFYALRMPLFSRIMSLRNSQVSGCVTSLRGHKANNVQ